MTRMPRPWKHIAKDSTISWRARLSITDPATGKRSQPQRSWRTKRDAEEGIVAWLAELAAPPVPPPVVQMTVGDLLTRFLAARTPPVVRQTTWAMYEQSVRLHLRPVLGDITLSQLGPAHLTAWQADKLAAGVGARTINLARQRLKEALDDAVRDELVTRNVARLIKPVPDHPRQMQTWDREQVARFLAICEQSRWPALWPLLLGTGMRRGEALGLWWEDLDLQAGTVRIQRTLEPLKGGAVEQEPKTRHSRRTLPLPPAVVQALRAHQEQARARGEARPRQAVFQADGGGTLEPAWLWSEFRRLVALAEVPPCRLHDLRHSAATLWLAAGVSVHVVSQWLGHSNVTVTLRVYAHVTKEMFVDAAEMASAAIFGEPPDAPKQPPKAHGKSACAPSVRLDHWGRSPRTPLSRVKVVKTGT